jgi:hypothetical protein
MQPPKLFVIALLLIGSLFSNAQDYNPYKSIGKKGKILTASNGKYVEVFDYDSVQRIGSVLFNIKSKRIIVLLDADSIFQIYSDNSSSSRWYSIDPLAHTKKNISYSPYSFVRNNPIVLVDPDGKDWFYYQAKGEKGKTWHYHKGDEAKYINTKGKEVTTKKGYDYLVTFKATGTNSEGAKTGTITVFNQDKAVVKVNNAFSGGTTVGLLPTKKGNYIMNLSVRDLDGPQKMNAAKDNPEPAWGIQKIPDRYLTEGGVKYDVGGAYGGGRIRLMEADENLNVTSTQVHGYYLHGKYDAHNYTHGCVCDKTETVFSYFWSGGGKDVRGYVPFSVE